jgi:hypothetical protein
MKPPSIKKTAVIVVTVVVGTIVAAGIWCLYSAAKVSMEAEKTLGTYYMVIDLVSTYVEKTSGKWPRNWEDLRQIPPSREWLWKWPDDIGEIQKRIRIDFSVTTAEVAKQDPEHFRAIEPVGPNYGSYPSSSLVSLCKKFEAGHAESDAKDRSADGVSIGGDSKQDRGRADTKATQPQR